MKTFFAPAERASMDQVRKQQAEVSSTLEMDLIGETITDMIAILNEHRQIVYANPVMTRFAAKANNNDLCGIRPGELFGCVHAHELPGGCGTSPSCKFCGAGTAIVDVLSGAQGLSNECVISVSDTVSAEDLSFDVSVAQFQVSGETYILVYFKDSRDKNRRAVLERVFFHDILNTVSSLKVYVDLMKRETGGSDYITTLEDISKSLIDEIESHKLLANAESGILSTQENLISSQALALAVISTFASGPNAKGKKIVVDSDSESFGFVSDEVIVRRILVNMIKNALEASGEDDSIVVSYARNEESVIFAVSNPGTIEKDIRGRIFTRYFSTKGENRGLGTFGMRLLAERYLGGGISFDPGDSGTVTFTVTFPYRAMESLGV